MRERLWSLSGARHLAHPLVPKQSGYVFLLARRVERSFTSNAEFVGSSLSIFVSVNRLRSFSGIRSISMADDVSQITSVLVRLLGIDGTASLFGVGRKWWSNFRSSTGFALALLAIILEVR